MARRPRLGRRRRAADRPGRNRRRLAAGRVRDSRLGHAEGNGSDRGGVRLGAGRSPERGLRSPRGRAARHTHAPGGDRGGRGAPEVAGVRAKGRRGLESVGDPFGTDSVSDDGRIAYAEAQFDQTIEDKDRDAVVAVQEAVRETVEPAGVVVEYNGEAEFPPIEQGASEGLGLLAAIIVLLLVFRTFVAMLIPIVLAIVALATAFLLLFILAGLTDINTITPILVSMIGLGVGIDYSLFIVTRFRQLL
ncbi:MAG: MMPL family transporter, partial [Actinobacteria bacterium]|nr:MMPL family transporter [Actinomycetota bacterium]